LSTGSALGIFIRLFIRTANGDEQSVRPARTDQIAVRLYKGDLETLRQRVAALGGSLMIDSIDAGARLEISLPR
jgi:signal transduction histidine kinase